MERRTSGSLWASCARSNPTTRSRSTRSWIVKSDISIATKTGWTTSKARPWGNPSGRGRWSQPARSTNAGSNARDSFGASRETNGFSPWKRFVATGGGICFSPTAWRKNKNESFSSHHQKKERFYRARPGVPGNRAQRRMFGGKQKETVQQQDNRAFDTRSKPFTRSHRKKTV